jgi:flagellar basal body-associated protein FliL
MTNDKAFRNIFILAFILIVLISSVIGVSTFWLISHSLEHGVRGTVERIWCGQQKDCKLG